jgi:hypothetical protein
MLNTCIACMHDALQDELAAANRAPIKRQLKSVHTHTCIDLHVHIDSHAHKYTCMAHIHTCIHASQRELAAANRTARAAESERDRIQAQLDHEMDACALLEAEMAALKRDMVWPSMHLCVCVNVF